MDLLYKNNRVDVYFDKKRNMLIQKWKHEDKSFDEVFRVQHTVNLEDKLQEITQVFLKHKPEEELENELRILLFQLYIGVKAEA